MQSIANGTPISDSVVVNVTMLDNAGNSDSCQIQVNVIKRTYKKMTRIGDSSNY